MEEIKDLDELKKIELGIMIDIHQFCVKNNIRYFLSYGTLIGAVRHHGFIPWDDDIDIIMLREDYEKFIKIFPKDNTNSNFYIAGKFTHPCYPRNMIKVCDKRTVLSEPDYDFQDDIGVFVDIWPLDGAPNNDFIRKIHLWLLGKFFGLTYSCIEKTAKTGLKNRVYRKLSRKMGIRRILDKQEKLAKKYSVNSSNYLICASAGKKLYKKEWFSEEKLMPFEEEDFFVPIGYDGALRVEYGDYMKLPPVNERKPHHVMNAYKR